MTKEVSVVFPHQLFLNAPHVGKTEEVCLVEEHLFFKQYAFHKQKIAFHRASMKNYELQLSHQGEKVDYVESSSPYSDLRNWKEWLVKKGVTKLHLLDPCDDYLERRLLLLQEVVQLEWYDSPAFLNSKSALGSFFREDKKLFFQTSFYKQQRKNRGILLDEDGSPEGGKWTYDGDNRKKYPKGKQPPVVRYPSPNEHWKEAVLYVRENFSGHLGELSEQPYYPTTHEQAQEWLEDFLSIRFREFGPYEDALVSGELLLNHSGVSPLLNSGLLTPQDVLQKAIDCHVKLKIPINSTEGFVRQLIGWREFIRGMYVCKGRYSRTCNYWGFTRSIPPSFYHGTTGITPLDEVIKKVLKTGYCHHIERLMVLGNFMLLCEFNPNEVYRWFMELFIDAYDWVMVPNVYGMASFADGGTFATKPYIGGSNYLKKMSNYESGEWESIWDGLFWRFINKQRAFFLSNPRMGMLVRNYDKMPEEKKLLYESNASQFLEKIDTLNK